MVKLKEQGHRVLIYSQFQHMLDILEDYLTYKVIISVPSTDFLYHASFFLGLGVSLSNYCIGIEGLTCIDMQVLVVLSNAFE